FPVTDNFLTTLSFSSQTRDGYQKVIPFPADSEMGRVPYMVDPQTAFPKAGYDTSKSNCGPNLQVIRGKALLKVSDAFTVTIGGDYAHQDQSSFPETVMAVTLPSGENNLPAGIGGAFPPRGGAAFMGEQWNLCIATPAAVLNDPVAFNAMYPGTPPFFGT